MSPVQLWKSFSCLCTYLQDSGSSLHKSMTSWRLRPSINGSSSPQLSVTNEVLYELCSSSSTSRLAAASSASVPLGPSVSVAPVIELKRGEGFGPGVKPV